VQTTTVGSWKESSNNKSSTCIRITIYWINGVGLNTIILIPKGPNVRTTDKPVLGSVTWSHSIIFFFETFCEHVSWNKLCRSINFIIFGPMDQKLWVLKKFRRNMDRADMCCSQPARIDFISPKRWAARIRRFEKCPLKVSSPVFWTLPLYLERWKLPFFMELRDYIFFQIIFSKIRIHLDLYIHCLDFCLRKKRIAKNPTRIATVMEYFYTLLNARCIWICSTHLLPLRFYTQVRDMICIEMVQMPKVT
jgi:hypothetical protein